MTRLLPACLPGRWPNATEPILGTQISLSTPSILNSLLLLTDVIQPLKKTTGRIYLSPKPGARRSASVVLAASPLFFTTLRSDISYCFLIDLSISIGVLSFRSLLITTPILVLSLIPLMLHFLIHAPLRSQNQHRSASFF